MRRRNPIWQAHYDNRWYLYVKYTPEAKTLKAGVYGHNTKTNVKTYHPDGRNAAHAMAKALTYNPAVESITAYPSKRSAAKGFTKKVWTRERGWR